MIGIAFIYPQYLWLLLLIPLTVGLALLSRRAVSRPRLWGGLALRVILLLLIIAALAGIQLRLPSNTLTAVFVIDLSDSIPAAEQARAETLVRDAITAMPRGDKAAVVVFGEDALVERLASPDSSLSKITSIPVTTRTDLASALQLGMALFPDEGAHRLVLVSDGRENLNFALKQAELAAMQDIELQYIPLGENQAQTEVLVDSVLAPASVREGQNFNLDISIQSTAPVGSGLRVFADGALIHTQELNLHTGANHYSVPIQNAPQGFHRYRVQIIPDADTRLQNNEASAFTNVQGPPSVLIVEGAPGEGDNLTTALQAAKMRVTRLSPSNLPTGLDELAGYDAIVLANVPAAALPAGAMQALPIYVRDLGKGLLMTGGDSAFGAGGYLRTPIETAMPVYMDVKSRELAANLALVVAVDKSGSMGRCHCDNPDLNQTYTPVQTGQPKVDIAKEAIMRAAAALGDEDQIGIVTFDSQAHWTLNIEPRPSDLALENAIGTFKAEGSTNMTSGVTAAYNALEKVNAKRKHIILMTDGWVRTGDLTPLVEKMRGEGITLSVIAAGEGSAQYLKALAQNGGGRYYPAVDMMSVPDIFLKETVKSIGQYVIEEPFFPLPASPSPVLKNIDLLSLPGLLGYNGTSPKSAARMDLLTPRGDPLLATWQYGLGRSAAWTSDLKGRWGVEWVRWKDFARFSAQLVGWLLPAPPTEGITAQISLSDAGALIHVDAKDKAGRPLDNLDLQANMVGPDLNKTSAALQQVGQGQYQATLRADQPGAYMAWVGGSGGTTGSNMLGLVVPYSPEYRSGGLNRGLLDQLARVTGGGPLLDPLKAFLHNLPAADSAREIWRALLLIAALLFPLDVALRRLTVTRRDLAAAQAWLRQHLPGSRQTRSTAEPRLLDQLFSARERARARGLDRSRPTDRNPIGDRESSGVPPHPSEPPPPAPPKPPTPNQPTDTFTRLREARRRRKS